MRRSCHSEAQTRNLDLVPTAIDYRRLKPARRQIVRRKVMFLILDIFILPFVAELASAQTLKIPYVSISGFQAPLYLGERAGLFKKNQLEAQLIYMPAGSFIAQT